MWYNKYRKREREESSQEKREVIKMRTFTVRIERNGTVIHTREKTMTRKGAIKKAMKRG